jgi:hypothetical protein
MTDQEITILILLLIPVLIIQLGLVIYALVDLARRKQVRGKRWIWTVALIVTAVGMPSGIITAALYLIWGRHVTDADEL